MITASHLTKNFGRLRALDDLSVTMRRGQSILLFALTIVGGAYHWVGALFAGLLIRALPACAWTKGASTCVTLGSLLVLW